MTASLEPLPDEDFCFDFAPDDDGSSPAGREQAEPETVYVIHPRKVLLALIAPILLLAVTGVTARLAINRIGPDSYRGVVEIAKRFDLDHEINLPTWYSSITLACCAALLGAIYVAKKRDGGPYVLHWGLLAVVFLVMSIDETANLHEILIVPIRRRLGTHGLLYFAWVIPGAVCVAALGLAYLKFLFHLDRRSKRLFLVAAAIYVGGALGVEFLGGACADWYGLLSARYLAVMAVEEVLEMIGIAVFIYALLSYLQRRVGPLRIGWGRAV